LGRNSVYRVCVPTTSTEKSSWKNERTPKTGSRTTTTKFRSTNEEDLECDYVLKLICWRSLKIDERRRHVTTEIVTLYEKEDHASVSTPRMELEKDLMLERSKMMNEESTINGQRTNGYGLCFVDYCNVDDIKSFFLTNLFVYTPEASKMCRELRVKMFWTSQITLKWKCQSERVIKHPISWRICTDRGSKQISKYLLLRMGVT